MSTAKRKPRRSPKSKSALDLSPEAIRSRILFLRGKRVLLDADLAKFYGVQTSNLNKAVARNVARFPEDFAFKLSREETRTLIFQSGTSNEDGESAKQVAAKHAAKSKRGGTRKPATVFTEQGVAMLASVLRSERAVAMSIAIIRAFVQLRELLTHNQKLAGKLAELEERIESHDESISNLFEAMRQLLATSDPEHDRKIGFHRGNR
jgi:phage regulator Rha-like protein